MKLKHLFIILPALALAACSFDRLKNNKSDVRIELSGIIENFDIDGTMPITLYGLKEGKSDLSSAYMPKTEATLASGGTVELAKTYYWPMGRRNLKIIGLTTGDSGNVEMNGNNIVVRPGEGVPYDILLSNNVLANYQSGISERHMVFRHITTQLSVKIAYEKGVDELEAVNLLLTAGSLSGQYNPFESSQTATTDNSGSYELRYDGYDPTLKTNPEKRYYLVPDGSTVPEIAILNDASYDTYAITGDAIKLESGNSYTLTITMGTGGLSSVTCAKGKWQKGEPANAPNANIVNGYVTVLMDNASTPVTAIELGDNSGNSVKSSLNPSNKSIEYISLTNALTSVAVYVGDKKVIVGANPNNTNENLWSFNKNSNTLTVELVIVSTLSQLKNIGSSDGLRKHYHQLVGLDLSSETRWVPIGLTAPFTGSYDGNGQSLSNVVITRTADYAGFFGINQGTIKGIRLDGDVTGSGSSGSVCGDNDGGFIYDCRFEGEIIGTESVGGICGVNANGIVSECRVSGFITGAGDIVGGICGRSTGIRAIIEGCVNSAKIGTAGIEITDTGGICGYNEGTITRCANSGDIEHGGIESINVGGICGRNTSGTITAAFNSGEIEGANNVGGVAGLNGGNLSACYSSGAITGETFTGGVAGKNNGTMADCYWYGYDGPGSNGTTAGAVKFSQTAWPSDSASANWGVVAAGGKPGSGKWWSSLGLWSSVAPAFPQLWLQTDRAP